MVYKKDDNNMIQDIFTVTGITKYIKGILSTDPELNDLWVTGEVSNFHHHNSGHMYFTLKDKDACLAAIMFKSYNRKVKFDIEDGLKVNAHGHIGVYEPRGTYNSMLIG